MKIACYKTVTLFGYTDNIRSIEWSAQRSGAKRHAMQGTGTWARNIPTMVAIVVVGRGAEAQRLQIIQIYRCFLALGHYTGDEGIDLFVYSTIFR